MSLPYTFDHAISGGFQVYAVAEARHRKSGTAWDMRKGGPTRRCLTRWFRSGRRALADHPARLRRSGELARRCPAWRGCGEFASPSPRVHVMSRQKVPPLDDLRPLPGIAGVAEASTRNRLRFGGWKPAKRGDCSHEADGRARTMMPPIIERGSGYPLGLAWINLNRGACRMRLVTMPNAFTAIYAGIALPITGRCVIEEGWYRIGPTPIRMTEDVGRTGRNE